ncbi:MAG: hypothetical protein ACYC6X_03480 [Minisyncoccota bacterium]
MTKKIALALGTFGFLAVAGVAFAQTTTSTTPTPTQPMVLQVGPNGKALLRGTIDSVSAASITVKSWGGDWVVNIPSSAQVLPQGATLASFQTGDFVGVQGTVDQSTSWTVNASLVRDWTARQALNQEKKQNVQSVREMRTGVPRTVQGTVSDLSGESFTLTTSNTVAYSVSLTSGAKTLQRNWLTLDFSQVQNGDTVRVWGPVASSTISASIFRDVSIPRAR